MNIHNHVWLIDPNLKMYRNRGQKHGKREKFRRQPSENVPYKAADVAREGRVMGGGRTRGEQEITSPDVRSFGFRALWHGS